MKPKTTKKEFLDFFYSLSTEEALKIVKEYDKKHKTHLSKELEKLQVSEIERKLLEIGVNSTCPCPHVLLNCYTFMFFVKTVVFLHDNKAL